jgi:hypothetical protein
MVHIYATQPINKCHVNKLSQKLTYERHHFFFHFLYQNFSECLFNFFSNLHLKEKSQKNLNFFVEKMVKFCQKQNIALLGF